MRRCMLECPLLLIEAFDRRPLQRNCVACDAADALEQLVGASRFLRRARHFVNDRQVTFATTHRRTGYLRCPRDASSEEEMNYGEDVRTSLIVVPLHRGVRCHPATTLAQYVRLESKTMTAAARTSTPRSSTLLTPHLSRSSLRRWRGEEVDTAGDGFFATFDGPARAVGCARVIVERVRELGLEVRAGIHTGECEWTDATVRGIAVHVAARIAGEAGAGEVVVSSTVRDLVAGSGLAFEDRGRVQLKGIPGEWQLLTVR